MLRAFSFVVLAVAFACPMQPSPASAETPAADQEIDWTRTARVAGAAVYVDMEEEAMESLLSGLVSEGGNVIEADSELSNYLTDQQFDEELANIRRFVTAALLLSGGLTWLLGQVGADYLGFGYLVAFTIAGLGAYLAMAQTLRDLNYLSLVGNNPAS